jgi:hypothetical protein
MTNASRLVNSRSPAASAAAAAPLVLGPGNLPGKNSSPHYLDVGDNVYANVCSWLDVNCGDSENKWFIPGTCTGHGHRYAKVIYCGKEWCPVCGVKGSDAHNRRYVRWLTKIQQFKVMRYFVLTIPENIRYKYRTKESLKALGRSAQELMKHHGYKRGLRRWHWFGDPPDKKKNKNKVMKWHPHLNILVEGGYLNKQKLSQIKIDWAAILDVEVTIERDQAGLIESVHGIDIEVGYKSKPADMLGCMHYVTRSSFLDYEWDIDMAMELRNFRNMVVWGRDWKRESQWEPDQSQRISPAGEVLDIYSIEKLLEHECPHCGSQIIWNKALPFKILDLTDNLDLGAGFRYIIDGSSPGGLDESVKERLRTMRLVKAAKGMGAVEIKTDKPSKKGYWRYNPDKPKGRELFYYDDVS